MSQILKLSQIYFRERISWFPWGVLPFYIFFLSHGRTEHFHFILLLNIFFGLLFFRVFDDFFCRTYDIQQEKPHTYLKTGSQGLTFLILFFGTLFFSSTLFLVPIQISLFIFGFVIAHLFLYKLLETNPKIVYISLLKYPLFFFLVALTTQETNFIWPILGSLFFIFREILEESLKKRNKMIEILLFLSLLLSKYLLRIR